MRSSGCNALTEYYNAKNGSDTDLDCVYYTDSGYTIPIRTSTDVESINLVEGSVDVPYIKAIVNGNTNLANCIAEGFRLKPAWQKAYA